MALLPMALPMILPIKKRKREDDERQTHTAANILISNVKKSILATNSDRVYPCPTCNKEFSSHQALGGHCAGHKNRTKIDADVVPGSVSTKLYTCSFCYEDFASGQAKGGHMRKHREAMEEKAKRESPKCKVLVSECTFPEKYKENETLLLLDSASVSERETNRERLGGEGSRCNCGVTLVTRDFFPREPVRSEMVPVVIEPVLKEHNSWLDLKLGPPGGD